MTDDQKIVDYLKWVTADLHETRRRLEEAESGRHEPIAVVSMACRFPGGVGSPEQLWQLLSEGRDAMSPCPPDRGWPLTHMDHLAGGFLDAAGDFDAGFFGVSPNDALAMDPQQRHLLEVTWEAVERAGIDPLSLRGTRTGVFVGTNGQDFTHVVAGAGPQVQQHAMTGLPASVLSGRISYTFGLEGPAVTLDTACSSGLVAMHWAAQALRAGECTSALVGGVTVMTTPGAFAGFSEGLAVDGRCKSYADGADGTGWSEGVAVLLLERLSDARRLGHDVLAVLRGSAVNQDGASNGLTVPNGPAQERVIRQALAAAGLSPGDVDAVEGHGTGTTLGDPIEAQALLATYGQDRENPLWLGSVKSNLGHTQAVAGLAGVLKMILALQNARLPRTLHVDRPSQHVDWSSGAVRLLTEAVDWPQPERPRRAGVSAFGISGTNAHVILEQAPPTDSPRPESTSGPQPTALLVSARSASGLRGQAARLADFLGDPAQDGIDLTDVAHSLAHTRSTFDHRAVVLASSPADAASALHALAEERLDAAVVQGRRSARTRSVMLFSGQGGQRSGMGQALYQRFPQFAEAWDEVAAALDPLLGRSLTQDVRSGQPGQLAGTGLAQPALFALHVASYRLARSWGLRPAVLVGHSVGEIAAAHVAGVLSLPDAARLVAARARLMQALPEGGAMVAVQAPENAIDLTGFEGQVSVAAVNGPTSVVLSGAEDAVLAVAGRFDRTRRLNVSHAFHSPLMQPMMDEFTTLVADLDFQEASIPIVSTVTGDDSADLTDPGHWVTQVTAPVRFDAALRVADRIAVGAAHLTLGPDGALAAMAAEVLTDNGSSATVHPLLRADHDETDSATRAAAELHVRGLAVDWAQILPAGRVVSLPTYAFQHERYWPAPAPNGSATDLGAAGITDTLEHPVLGAGLVPAAGGGMLVTGRLSLQSQSWLEAYRTDDEAGLPASTLLELAIRAGDEVGCDRVETLELTAPLRVSSEIARTVQVALGDADEQARRRVRIFSRAADAAPEEEWTEHAQGVLVAGGEGSAASGSPVWPPSGALAVDVAGRRPEMVRGLWRRDDEVFVEVARPEEEAEAYGLHPALLDAALGVLPLTGVAAAPLAWQGVSLHAEGASVLRVRLTRTGPDTVSLVGLDAAGEPVLSVHSLRVCEPSALPAGPHGSDAPATSLFRLSWNRIPGSEHLPQDTRLEVVPYRSPLSAMESGPDAVVVDLHRDQSLPMIESVHQLARRALGLIHEWIEDERFKTARMVFLTRGAMAVTDDDPVLDLAAATAWGLIRSAQAENPNRFVLLDLDDGSEGSDAVVQAALATGQLQVAVRAGALHEPRISRQAPLGRPRSWNPDGTVLITGGTGGLGARLARHLITERGVRHLVLTSRAGLDAPGARDLREDLAALGATAHIAACDAGDRTALSALLAEIPPEHPLTAVIHTAGYLDDGIVARVSPDSLSSVLHPKVDGGWLLHELTQHLPLEEFILFSSVAGTLGGAGQGSYAAANVFLDSLARYRHQAGLPATAIAWGPWSQGAGMTSNLAKVQIQRMIRTGLPPMAQPDGLALFDAAIGLGRPELVATRLNLNTLRRARDIPLLRNLRRGQRPRAASAPSAQSRYDQLRVLPEAVRREELQALVTERVAAILGHSDADAVDTEQGFLEMGFDSLAVMELRYLLSRATGLELSPSTVLDERDPQGLTEWMVAAYA
ncbi:hypothetical protein Kisp01_22290 [Kineosporia sp. NBRC 101677]|uniref:type I polyketide synthase n=1 Tax=Kineosporia sp. NBRC 101677 TaxID=3032197 RepID=UPI0024A12B34|nr:type I polyketide synthase [Kineosporia sp. NBRC 101677]GLY15214.1 hypothetical protein Kisp01_22290 [Kineosporia sp. NBRC 101677]